MVAPPDVRQHAPLERNRQEFARYEIAYSTCEASHGGGGAQVSDQANEVTLVGIKVTEAGWVALRSRREIPIAEHLQRDHQRDWVASLQHIACVGTATGSVVL